MRIALGVKQKLRFVDATIPMPSKDNEFFEQWKRFDYMVTSWILNSISKDLVDGFIYTVSLRDLGRVMVLYIDRSPSFLKEILMFLLTSPV